MKEREYVGFVQLGREIGVPPRMLCNLFFGGQLDDRHGKVIAGRRLVYRDMVPEVRAIVASVPRRRKRQPVTV
jgi:hypothetical protein